MSRITPRDLVVAIVVTVAIAAGFSAAGLGLGPPSLRGDVVPMTLGAIAAGMAFGYAVAAAQPSQRDPWRLQARLMRISGQPAPKSVQVNKYTITYVALCLEELAETALAITGPLQRYLDQHETMVDHPSRVVRAAWESFPADEARDAGRWLGDTQQTLLTRSRALRACAEKLPESFHLMLSPAERCLLADGCTDLSVVACGLAVASGVPGAPAYAEVVGSNLSKANPATGVIDKDPSGKWVKGAGYVAPDMLAVLDEHKGN